MFKLRFLFIFAVLFLILTACHSYFISQKKSDNKLPDSILLLPTTEIPIPLTNLDFLFPIEPTLEIQLSPRRAITEHFSTKEKTDIAVIDPLLMKDKESMILDLNLIQLEDYAFPLPGAKLISAYAGRRKNHSGVDLKTRANDTIVSAFDGIVRLAKPYYAYGNVIVVRHYNGLETVYSHNSKNLVKPGDRVKAGDPIALTGRTGRATTEHLHFEVRVNGQHFNPNIIFNFNTRKLNSQCLEFFKKGNRLAVRTIEFMPHQLEQAYRYYPPLTDFS